MPRKPKDIYVRIKEKQEQIERTKQKLLTYENELIQLNKERESLEMKEIFEKAKENNLSYKEVINLITNVHSNKNKS